MTSDVIRECLALYDRGETPDAVLERAAVKEIIGVLTARVPGRSVEVRVPPYAAVQIIAGPTHRRGTPPASVQLVAQTLVQLAVGRMTWGDAVEQGLVRASGQRSDLSFLFPLGD
jgi:hypothetical protein